MQKEQINFAVKYGNEKKKYILEMLNYYHEKRELEEVEDCFVANINGDEGKNMKTVLQKNEIASKL